MRRTGRLGEMDTADGWLYRAIVAARPRDMVPDESAEQRRRRTRNDARRRRSAAWRKAGLTGTSKIAFGQVLGEGE